VGRKIRGEMAVSRVERPILIWDETYACMVLYSPATVRCALPGATKNLEDRYKDHCSGEACRTTKLDPPAASVHSEKFETFSGARKREAQIKRWSRAKKEALVSGDVSKLRELSKSREIR